MKIREIVIRWKSDPPWLRGVRALLAIVGLVLLNSAVGIFAMNYVLHRFAVRNVAFCLLTLPVGAYLFVSGLTGRSDFLQRHRDKDDALERRKVQALAASLRKTDDPNVTKAPL